MFSKKILYTICFFSCFDFILLHSQNVKFEHNIPKADYVYFERISKVDGSGKVALREDFPESEYRRFGDNILINRLRFIGNDKTLFQIDHMNIWHCLSNSSKNVYLVSEVKESYKIGKMNLQHGRLLLLDFVHGETACLDEDIYDYALSEKGDKVLYIKNFDSRTESKITIGYYKNKKIKFINFDYSAYVASEVLPHPRIYFVENKIGITLTEEYVPYCLLLFDFNGKNIEKYYVKYDEQLKRYYFENEKGETLLNFYQ